MGVVAAVWGVSGFLFLLGFAIYRLVPIALQAFADTLSWHHWLLLVLNITVMAYYEGYRGFQRSYSPRLIARSRYLSNSYTPVSLLLAPLFCMGYFSAPKRRLIGAWLLTGTVIVLIVLFNHLPQPWRGLLDAGVVVGLSWGIAATLFYAALVSLGYKFDYEPQISAEEHSVDAVIKGR